MPQTRLPVIAFVTDTTRLVNGVRPFARSGAGGGAPRAQGRSTRSGEPGSARWAGPLMGS